MPTPSFVESLDRLKLSLRVSASATEGSPMEAALFDAMAAARGEMASLLGSDLFQSLSTVAYDPSALPGNPAFHRLRLASAETNFVRYYLLRTGTIVMASSGQGVQTWQEGIDLPSDPGEASRLLNGILADARRVLNAVVQDLTGDTSDTFGFTIPATRANFLRP
jgi:hypothetical protein